MKTTIEIKIWGIVQGVGFRPFISRLAAEYSITGSVLNEAGSVRIIASGDQETVEAFYRDILAKKPEPSELVHIEKTQKEYEACDGFKILESSEGGNDIIFIPPDLSICRHCEEELYSPSDKRYRHPFISCMECGPRYSIMDKVPYDRDNTSMVDFDMCDFCNGQYTNMAERRYHAQTISCHDCGPVLIYRDKSQGRGESYPEELDRPALLKAIDVLNSGGIIAVKGVGGYHLACSPFKTITVENLRELKGREAKPFAVMFKDIAQLGSYCNITAQESVLLQSKEKPIVLLEQKANPMGLSPSVCKSSRALGAFLPYTPLQHLLIEGAGPLIMTSANISDRPIIIDDSDALALNSPFLDGVLYNKRAIRIRIDDSVVKHRAGVTQFIRRSRGYAPLPVHMADSGSDTVQVLACGGQLKNTFSLSKGSFVYPSQYIGDIEDADTFEVYRDNIERMQSLFRIKPSLICCDLHPDYLTTRYAEQYAEEHQIPLLKIQHHHAHIASVMAEHGIDGPVIGVAFDGTGYGTDGKIWGSEFLICSKSEFTRAGHLKYVQALGGDTSIKEAWKSACAYLYDSGLEDEIKDSRWPLIKAALQGKINRFETSSMGRLFDAVSAILDIKQVAGYEGECAILLENYAAEHSIDDELQSVYPYKIEEEEGILLLDVSECIRNIVQDKKSGVETSVIACRFHRTIAELTAETCKRIKEKRGINKAALSGGVFQNSILLEMTMAALKKQGFEVYTNQIVPPNDGGISLGQAYIGNHCKTTQTN